MALPPPWYVLLIGTTLLAAPWLLRRAHGDAARWFTRTLLGGLALYETGLILLFYSKLLCWLLVTSGLATIAAGGTRRAPWSGALLVGVPAAVAGVAFQVLPQYDDFFVYFAFAIPLLFSAAVAIALVPWLRWGAGPRIVAFAAAMLAFGAMTPASGFAFTFLRHYEVFHLPLLLTALAALAWFLVHAAPVVERERRGATSETRGDRAARSAHLVPTASILVAAGALVAMPAFAEAPLDMPLALAGWALLAAAVMAALLARHARSAAGPAVLAGGAAGGLTASLLGARSGAEAFQSFGGGPAPESVLFYIAGLAITLLAIGATVALAALGTALRATRRRPPPAICTTIDHIPGVDDLARFRATLRKARARSGVLQVAVPLHPTEGLPEPTARWLAAQDDGPRVHLALTEGQETFHVPDLEVDDGA